MTAAPKAEMHVHLEGTARPQLARRMAQRYGVPLDGMIAEDGGTYRWSDFSEFLVAYDRVASLFRAPDDYHDLVTDYLDELQASGCIYAEIIVSPDHPDRIGLPADDYLDGIVMGIDAHAPNYGDDAVEVRLLVTGVRHKGPSSVKRAAQTAARWHADGPRTADGLPLVVGFGLAGDERVGHVREFADAFDIAHDAGLGTSCHAGEVCGAQSVRDALDHLRPDRIDHGVRAIKDGALVERLARAETLLAISIGSNVALGVVESVDAHPIRALADAGCRIALGADDPPFFGNSIGGEYADAASLGLDPLAITRNAIEGSFCDPATRARLLAKLPEG